MTAAGMLAPPLAGPAQVPVPLHDLPPFLFWVVVVLFGLVGGRLLGVKVSLLRAAGAGFLGVVAGFAVTYGVATSNAGPVNTGLTFGLPALLGTMVALAGFELVARPGTLTDVERGFARVPHPLRAIRGRAARGRRYAHIVWIASRHGLDGYLGLRGQRGGSGGRRGTSVRQALQEAGGVFVKLGQVLSTRADLLPADVVAELSGLQDAVPPAPEPQVAELLRRELGADPREVFATFDPVPLAAGSIAQVHRARLRSGEPVVVKVQRPGIRELVERDLDIMRRLARAAESRAPRARELGMVELASGFAEALQEELDFQVEARNLVDVSRAVGGSATIRVPAVHRHLSTGRVLVVQWLDGVGVREAGDLLGELGADRAALARDLLRCMLRLVLLEGVFHADPHPGNVMVLRDGSLGLIDLGSVGRLDALQQSALRRMLAALDRRDAAQMRDAILDLTEGRDARTEDLLERALAQLLARRLGPGMLPGAELFGDLLRLLVEFRLAFPAQVSAVFRAMVTLEGTLRALAPGFPMVDESRALAAEWAQDALTPASIRAAVADEVMAQLPVLRRLPRRLDRVAATAERGGLTVRVRLFEDERDARLLLTIAGRFLLAFLGAAVGLMSILLLESHGGPALLPSVTVLQFLGYVGLVASMILMLRVIVAVLRDRAV